MKLCAQCADPIPPTRATQAKTCSDACAHLRSKAYFRNYCRTVRRTPAAWARNRVLNLRLRAKERRLPFDLEPSDLVLPERCPILGTPLVIGRDEGRNDSPSVDRLVPELGYVKGNVQVISDRANRLKQDATVAELRAIISYMEQHIN